MCVCVSLKIWPLEYIGDMLIDPDMILGGDNKRRMVHKYVADSSE